MAGLGSGTNFIPSNVGYQSSVNTSTGALAASATYTGTGELNQLPYVIVDCTADVSGTLFFEFSVDNSNWSAYPKNGISVSAGSRVVHSALKGGRYFRARYVNGATLQNTFRLYTYFDIQGESGKNVNQSITKLNKFAFRDDVDIAHGDALVISNNSTNAPVIMTGSDTFRIDFNDTTDGSGTTGALVLRIEYLDSNDELQVADHTLSGTTPDTTSFSGKGINNVTVISAGSNNANVNNISLSDTTNTDVQAFISAELSTSHTLLAHLPANSKTTVSTLSLNASLSGSSPVVTFKVSVYDRETDVQRSILNYKMNTAVQCSVTLKDEIEELEGANVVWVTAATDTDDTEVSARLSLNIYDSV